MNSRKIQAAGIFLTLLLFTGSILTPPTTLSPSPAALELEEELVALAHSPADLPEELTPVASGLLTAKTEKAIIDYSNTRDGYVMVRYTNEASQKLKVQIKGPATTNTYNMPHDHWEIFPLCDGDGKYNISVYEYTSGKEYSAILSVDCNVTLLNEFSPFLFPNQFVDYSAAPNTVIKAAELTAGLESSEEKIFVIYDFVVNHLSYDEEKAQTVQPGYLPVLDTVLADTKGICFDYASLMAGMLRSQGIPCKLLVGYAGTAYHAWVDVWSEENGWQRMDPTFASTENQSAAITAYIGDGENYTVKYVY